MKNLIKVSTVMLAILFVLPLAADAGTKSLNKAGKVLYTSDKFKSHINPVGSYIKPKAQSIYLPTRTRSVGEGNYCLKAGETVSRYSCKLVCYSNNGKTKCDDIITKELIKLKPARKEDFGFFPGHPHSGTQGGWCAASIQPHHPLVLQSLTPIKRVDVVSTIRCAKPNKLAPVTSSSKNSLSKSKARRGMASRTR